MLAIGFHDVPPGHVAAIVTHLEMRSPPPPRPDPRDGPWPIRRVVRPDLCWYRDLYRRIGTAWLWAARLRLPDEALAALIDHPDHELWVLAPAGQDEGIAELDFRQPGACELRLFGVTERLAGTGAARAMMNHALARVWSRPGIGRFWLHTCSLDHPRALPFYRRSGFRPCRLQVEVMADPRLDGTLPADAAPSVPIIPPLPAG